MKVQCVYQLVKDEFDNFIHMLVHIMQWLACKEAFKMDIKEILKHQPHLQKFGYNGGGSSGNNRGGLRGILQVGPYGQASP